MRQYIIRLFVVCLVVAAAAPVFALSGAIFTTTSSCGAVDANRYLWQEDVYLNGGPNNDHAFGLDPGSYWVKVTTPDGTLLGVSSSAAVTVGSDGRFVSCYQLTSILNKASNGQPGYDISPNAEYKAWVSTTSEFRESESKTDNFRVDNPHILVTRSCVSDAFVNDTLTSIVTVTNTGSTTLTNVQVNDSVGGLLTLPDSYGNALAPGASYSWTITCSASPSGSFDTSVTASGSDDFFTYTATNAAGCSTQVWSLSVTKTASPSYTRDWHWQISKTANDSSVVTIASGAQAVVGFTITASATNVDSAWAVSGSVTVHNPAPMAASVSALADVLSDNTAVSLQCPGSAPFTIAANSDLTCTYSVSRGGPDNGSNTATATLANNNGNSTQFTGSASYVFGDPTTILHANATVTDAGISLANSDGSGAAGWSIAQSAASVPFSAPGGAFTYAATVTNVSVPCDTTTTASNTAVLTDGDHTLSASAAATLYTGVCPGGCTLTIGYWKTHAGFTGRNADRVTSELPQWLGNVAGAKSVKVTTAPAAVTLLSMSGDASNGVNKLYAQELAAKLNIFRGSSPAAVASAIAAADNFLASFNAADWGSLSKTQKSQVTSWASTFDQYNNGLIGPGHCN
jgi:uncharacterized repeat protein (TIGR01451 family)